VFSLTQLINSKPEQALAAFCTYPLLVRRDVVSVSMSRSRDVVSKRLGLVSVSMKCVGRSRSRLRMKIKCLGLVSVSYHRVSFKSQYAQLFASLQNCMYIVLNASILFTDSQAKVLFTSLLHTFAIAMQNTIQKVLFLDFANAKSLITSSKSTG